MISGKALVSSSGKMDESTMANGKMESSTVGVLSSRSTALERSESGRTEGIFSGLKTEPSPTTEQVQLYHCPTDWPTALKQTHSDLPASSQSH